MGRLSSGASDAEVFQFEARDVVGRKLRDVLHVGCGTEVGLRQQVIHLPQIDSFSEKNFAWNVCKPWPRNSPDSINIESRPLYYFAIYTMGRRFVDLLVTETNNQAIRVLTAKPCVVPCVVCRNKYLVAKNDNPATNDSDLPKCRK